MRERQRWQPEEDALLREYVKQYGAKEWALVSERMGRPLHRDPKSCHERWKNYLRPGLKKGSLSPDEQSLLISLQARYGNKWKAIAAHLPGRTPKRLGKWWEVFKEKQLKLASLSSTSSCSSSAPFAFPGHPAASAAAAVSPSAYEHILQTFAEKHALLGDCSSPSPSSVLSAAAPAAAPSVALSLSPPRTPELAPHQVPILMRLCEDVHILQTFAEKHALLGDCSSPSPSSVLSAAAPAAAPSVALSLSPPRTPELAPHQVPILMRLCEDVEEGRRAWAQHRKEAAWRLSRLEQQMETEKARKKREKVEEVEAKIRRLREEEKAWLERLDVELREKVTRLRMEVEEDEAKMTESLSYKHAKLTAIIQRIGGARSRR